jgi:acid phosphatase (class A)
LNTTALRACLCAALIALSTPALAQTQAKPYLSAAQMPDVKVWLPLTPAPGSSEDKFDAQTYFDTRALIGTPRGQLASDDDVYTPPELAPRFAAALGFTPSPEATPRLMELMKRAEREVEVMTNPIKRDPPEGRVRPFVAHPGLQMCPLKPAYARFNLAATGSFPSVHSAFGMMFALIFAELEPSHEDALLARGLDFGVSRVVCAFHYPSEVNAGRLAGAVMFARLMQTPEFRADLAAAKAEYLAAKAKR